MTNGAPRRPQTRRPAMQARLFQVAERLRSSLWVVPAVCTFVAAFFAVFLLTVDRQLREAGWSLPGTFQGGASSARAVLSTIAGSMITVAGTIYSITIVVLTLASAQFAPRVLRSFMRDRANQFVLGFFVATFTYCLLVLRAVQDTGDVAFVPHTAVTGGVVLALLSLGMLIYFIDHIFHGVQVSSIIATIAAETERHIDRIYPDAWHMPEPPAAAEELPPGAWAAVPARELGYLQYVDLGALCHLAAQEDLVLRVDRPAGAFIMAGGPLLYLQPPDALTDELAGALCQGFALGHAPTLQQDVAYGFRQIVDIALRAISPGINDPTTALNCLDHLGALLLRVAGRRMPERDCRDASGRLRILVHERTFRDLVRLSVDQVRHYGAGDPVIVIRMLDLLGQVAASTENPSHVTTLCEFVDRIAATAEHRLQDAAEIGVVREHAAEARAMADGTRLARAAR